MKIIPKAIACLLAAFLLLPTAHANEAICKPQKVKKVSRLCVVAIDPSGAPVAGVHLQVFDGEKEIAEGLTASDGRFSFDSLRAGSYQVKVHADGFKDDAFPIVVTNSSKKCKRAVEMLLYVGWLPCAGVIRLVKP
jgi:Carboxypeptidase regulatory-like domain